ncbi:unknown [Mycoplasma sp. CAG:877]|nr:unknown [Mycoplasma sp. CAG:877]
MIIGNNFNRNPNQNFENSNFNNQNRNNRPNQNSNQSQGLNQNNNFSNNLLTKDISSFKYANIENKTEVYDKSLAILHDRLKNKSITLDEFNRKCRELANKRNH